MLSFGVIGAVMFDLRKHSMKRDAEKRGGRQHLSFLLACEKLDQGKLAASKSATKGIAEPPRQRTNPAGRAGRDLTEVRYPPLLSTSPLFLPPVNHASSSLHARYVGLVGLSHLFPRSESASGPCQLRELGLGMRVAWARVGRGSIGGMEGCTEAWVSGIGGADVLPSHCS